MTDRRDRNEYAIEPSGSSDAARGPRLLTADEAAARLHMSQRTLRKLRQTGQIAYIALTDRLFRYTPEDCDAFIASRRRRDEPCPPPRMSTNRHVDAAMSKGASGGFMALRAARKNGSKRRPIEAR